MTESYDFRGYFAIGGGLSNQRANGELLLLEAVLPMALQETRVRALVRIVWGKCPSGPVHKAEDAVRVVGLAGDEDVRSSESAIKPRSNIQ